MNVDTAISNVLLETVLWCNSRLCAITEQESRAEYVRSLRLVGDMPRWKQVVAESMLSVSEWVDVVSDLTQRRRGFLDIERDNLLTQMKTQDISQSKLLVCQVSSSLHDGASQYESKGYLDLVDIPPWDTWILFGTDTFITYPLSEAEKKGYLVSWVPASFVDDVQKGIDANTTGCLQWSQDVDHSSFVSLELIFDALKCA